MYEAQYRLLTFSNQFGTAIIMAGGGASGKHLYLFNCSCMASSDLIVSQLIHQLICKIISIVCKSVEKFYLFIYL